MSSPVVTITPETTVTVGRSTMKRAGVHHLPVLERKRLVGIVCRHDLRGGPEDQPVADVMATEVVSARPETTVREAANLLRGRKLGCLPVLAEGQVVGMVTLSDLLDLLGRGVERPVGRSTRWTLRARGPRKTRPSKDRARLEHTR